MCSHNTFGTLHIDLEFNVVRDKPWPPWPLQILDPFKFWIMFSEVPGAMCFWHESQQSILVVKALGYEVEPLQAEWRAFAKSFC